MKQQGSEPAVRQPEPGSGAECGTWCRWESVELELSGRALKVVSADIAAGGVLYQHLPGWLRARFPALPGPEQPPRLCKSSGAERLRAAAGAGRGILPQDLE